MERSFWSSSNRYARAMCSRGRDHSDRRLDEQRKDESDEEGKVSGSRSGKRTAENVERGATIGGAGALGTILMGGGGAAAGGAWRRLVGGFIPSNGGDVRVASAQSSG